MHKNIKLLSKYFIVIALLVNFFDVSYGKPIESIPTLTLHEAILLALRKNPEIHSGKLQRVVDKFTLAIAYEKFSPQISLAGEVLYQQGDKSQYSAFPAVKWATPWGTSIETRLNPYYDSTGLNSNAHLGVTQHLLRGFGPTINQLSVVDAIDNEKRARLAWKDKVVSVIADVIHFYYQLVQDENELKINVLALNDAKISLEQMDAKINVGKLAPSEAIQQKATIANQALSVNRVKANISQDYQNLLALLGLDPTSKLNVAKQIQIKKASLPTLEQSIQLGLMNDSTYQQAILNYRKAERQLLEAKEAKKWQLDATAAIDKPIVGESQTGVTKSLTFDLSIPIRDHTKEKDVLSAKAALQKANMDKEQVKNKLITTITNNFSNVGFAEEQIKLSESAVDLARQSLDIAKIKFQYGKVSAFELTYLQSNLTTQQINYVIQQIQYLNSVEEFYNALGTTLQRWGITLSERFRS